MSKYEIKNIDWVNFLFLLLTPVFALLTIWVWLQKDGFSWGPVILGIIFYLLSGLSITAGYHRLFSHKAYNANPLVKLFFLIFGASTFQNSILKWGSDHRLHHQKVDTENDPYSINEGFWYAHMGWIVLKKNNQFHESYAKDFLKDRLVMWQHRFYIPLAVLAGFILPMALGEVLFNSWMGGLAIAGFARVVLVHHCTFFINSLCHYVGTSPYTDQNTAKDSWIMALFTFGEGYHNFHHYFQTDYRNGIQWYQFDPTKWLINLLRTLGLANKLRFTDQEKILTARMQMKIKSLNAKLAAHEKFQQDVEALKTKVLTALREFQELKNQYKKTKARELKAKMLSARQEFCASLEAWNQYLRFVKAYPIPQDFLNA